MGSFYDKIDRILYLQKYFDIAAILSTQNYGKDRIVDYYKKSQRLFYRTFASRQGFMHVGLSENGTYKKDAGYELYQLQIVQEAITSTAAADVLEIGCGQCANLSILSSQFPQVQFYGIDLFPNKKNVHKADNVIICQDDYHIISAVKNQSVDTVFAIETTCYSPHKAKLLDAVYKTLKGNGTFLLFDIFLGQRREQLEPIDELYLNIMERSYYLSPLDHYEKFIQEAEACGFTLCEDRNLSPLAMPYLIEIEQRMYRYLKAGGPLLKILLQLCPDAVSRSMPSGIMMRLMVEDGYLQYRLMRFRKDET
ncbi:MAG: methyltransferase domain-containing protein [Clostridiales bacterium]|nr:methyltransferase domain-containing protein [Clostridiales bacterium]